jgi:hypothetical protein
MLDTLHTLMLDRGCAESTKEGHGDLQAQRLKRPDWERYYISNFHTLGGHVTHGQDKHRPTPDGALTQTDIECGVDFCEVGAACGAQTSATCRSSGRCSRSALVLAPDGAAQVLQRGLSVLPGAEQSA